MANTTTLHNSLLPFTNFSIEQLTNELQPGINWTKLFNKIFDEANVTHSNVLIYSKQYLLQLNQLLNSYPRRTVDNYLCWTLIARYLPYLGPQFRKLFAEFRSRVPDISSGDPPEQPTGHSKAFISRWKECVHLASDGLEIPAILLFLKHKHDYLNQIELKINQLIDQIKAAFNHIIDAQNWINSTELKQNCKQRINDIQTKIGVPKFLRDKNSINDLYKNLNLNLNDVFISNVFKMFRHQVLLEIKKLNQKVDHDFDWIFQPTIANAFYEPSSNNMIIPTGILKYPLVSLDRPRYE